MIAAVKAEWDIGPIVLLLLVVLLVFGLYRLDGKGRWSLAGRRPKHRRPIITAKQRYGNWKLRPRIPRPMTNCGDFADAMSNY